MRRPLGFDVAISLGLIVAFACVSLRPLRVTRVPDAASQSYALAHAKLRESQTASVGGAREEARREAERALAAAPDWVAPQRLLDDLLREELLGLEALSAHHQEIDRNPYAANALYLAGRLEGQIGAKRFEKAVLADPELAWGYHGLAWEALRLGRLQDALRHGENALERAHDPWERGFFLAAIARYHTASGSSELAIASLQAALEDPEVQDAQRLELRVHLASVELGQRDRGRAMRGFRRALELIRRESLTDDELERLVERVRMFVIEGGMSLLELQAALAEKRGRLRDRLRGELLLEDTPTPLALGLLESSMREAGELEFGGTMLRTARFAAGQFSEAIDAWRAGLPRFVLDEKGMPKDERLARVVRSARALETDGLVAAEIAALLTRLGDATVQCGWFREARSVAAQLAAFDLDAALTLEARSLAGLELVQGVRRLLYRVDSESSAGDRTLESRGSIEFSPLAIPEGSEADTFDISDLNSLIGAMGPLFARANERLGGEADVERMRRSLLDSPRFDYGFIGSLVHPGPLFSHADEGDGLGRVGETVPGLASEMQGIGRFALLGRVAGSKPDGSVLKAVLLEPRSGEHLGVPWRGTVAWCEGTDVLARAGRRGAALSGAALHEGYWVDIEVIRRDLSSWNRLRERFSRQGMRGRIDTVLATRGVPLDENQRESSRSRRRRRSPGALLGESDRVRLAVLRDRAQGDAFLGRIQLDDLVEVTATHEEGHLCDRERNLPLARNMTSVFRLLLAGGFSPGGVQRQLEYRAQLVALCEVSDPRIALSDILRAAEGGSSITPHANAYAKLLGDLLLYLDRSYAREPESWPELDPGFTFAHQLHWLGPEQVRRIARLLAAKRDLVD